MELRKLIAELQTIAHEGYGTDEVLICAPEETYFTDIVGIKEEDGDVEIYIK